MNMRTAFDRMIALAKVDALRRGILVSSLALVAAGIGGISGCAKLNGDRASPSGHELSLSNTFMTIGATEYTLTTNNLPMTFNLKQGNEPYKFAMSFHVSEKEDFRLRFWIEDCEFAFTNGIATISGKKLEELDCRGFADGMKIASGLVHVGILNQAKRFAWYVRVYDDSRGEYVSYLSYCPEPPQPLAGAAKMIIFECSGVKIIHESNWYEWGCYW